MGKKVPVVTSTDKSPFVPLVNKVNSFHHKTPQRFKSEARITAEHGEAMAKTVEYNPELTKPETPVFQSDVRGLRKNAAKSTTEREVRLVSST